jgi:hypothetical protein
MKLYLDALSKGWKLTSKYPWLWFYGLFALLLSSNGGEFDFYFRNVDTLISLSQWKAGFENFFSAFQGQWIVLVVLGVIFLAAVLIVFYFSIISQNSLIYSTGRRSSVQLTFTSVYNEARKFFWPSFWINILAKLTIFIIITLLAIPYLVWVNKIYLVAVIFLLIPVVLVVSFIAKYALNYVILEKEKLGSAIKKAFILFKKNWIVSLEMAGIIFILSLALGLALLLVVGIIVAPAMSSAISTAHYLVVFTDIFNVFFLAVIILIILMSIAASIFSAWQWTAWSYLFQDFVEGPQESQIAKVFK